MLDVADRRASTSSSSTPRRCTSATAGCRTPTASSSSTPAACTGPLKRAGGVAALEGVRTPSRVAKAVLDYTDHHLLVGAGAQAFARNMGFTIEADLNTENSRAKWLEWKRRIDPEHYLDPKKRVEAGEAASRSMVRDGLLDPHRRYGTINCDGVSAEGRGVRRHDHERARLQDPGTRGRLADPRARGSGWTTRWAPRARPGAARPTSTTCRPSSSSRSCGAAGRPKDAGMEALRRVKASTVEKRLLDKNGLPNFQLVFYVLDEEGRVRRRLDVGQGRRQARALRRLHARTARSSSPASRSTRERPRIDEASSPDRPRRAGRRPTRSRSSPPRFFMMCGFTFTVFLSLFQLLPTAPFRILDLGGSKAVAGLFLGLLTYASALSAPITGALADRIGKRRMLLITSLAIACFSLAYAASRNYWLPLVLVFFHGLFWSGLLSASSAYMTEVIPESRRAEGIGYWGMATMLATAVSPGVGLWMYRARLGLAVPRHGAH